MDTLKTKLCALMGVFCLCLTGCGQQTLAQREIVRAIFLEQQGTECKAVLLLEDTDLPEGESGYKTADATAETFQKAIREAELSLDGTPFYGLMDLAALPIQANWQTVNEIGNLLYQQAQPAPEIALFLLDCGESPLPKSAGELYETLDAQTQLYDLHGGLERIFAQQEFCALPVWQESELSFALLRSGEEAVLCTKGLESQFAAVLTGQIRHLESYYAQGCAYCSADATVQWDAEKGKIGILLRLRKVTLQDLSGEDVPQSELKDKLATELQSAFERLNQISREINADPFRLTFWQNSVLEAGETDFIPQLSIEIEP